MTKQKNDTVRERIKEYFDNEGLVVRTTEELTQESWWEDYKKREFRGNEFYDYVAGPSDSGIPIYDAFRSRSMHFSEWLMERLREGIGSLGIEDPRILDLGTGTGLEAVFLAKEFPKGEVQGIDLSKPMIEAARERAQRNGVTNTRFSQGDFNRLGKQYQGYDTTMCLASINENLPYFGGMQGEIHRIIYKKAQGEMMGRTVSPGGLLLLSLMTVIPKGEKERITRYSLEGEIEVWKNILKGEGFRELEVETKEGIAFGKVYATIPIIKGKKF